jgi:hypothetical protein
MPHNEELAIIILLHIEPFMTSHYTNKPHVLIDANYYSFPMVTFSLLQHSHS